MFCVKSKMQSKKHLPASSKLFSLLHVTHKGGFTAPTATLGLEAAGSALQLLQNVNNMPKE